MGNTDTPLPATKSVRQKQKVGSGNLSLNSHDIVMGDLFHDHILWFKMCVNG